MLSRRRLQKLQGGPPRWWRLVSSLLFSGALVAVGATWYLGQHPTPTAAADQPNPTVSYQGTLSYSSGSPAPDSIHTVAFSVYSAASGGTPLWSETWATSTMFQTAITAQAVTSSVSLSYTEPTSTSADTNVYLYQTLYNLTRRDQVTVTGIDTGANTLSITPTARTWENGDYITTRLVTFDGLFSARLPATSTLESIFNVASSTRLYLGVNVNGDGEMQPRKQIAYAPLAINALYLGGVPSTSFARLDTANTFATTTFTGSPGGTAVNQGGLYVNPPSPDVNQTLLGVANNGSERLRVDAEGDVFASGTLSVLGIKTTSSNPLLLYGGAADSYVQIGQAPPANYLGFNATSSDDLMVGGQITVDDIARFSNSILGSSTLVVTGHTTLGDSLVVASRATFLGTGSQIVFQSVKPSGATSNSPLYIEVASSAGVDAPIIGVTYNGEDRFRLDGDGDLFASGTLSVLAVKTTSSNPLLVYGGSATSYVRVGQSLPAAYRGFSATSSDDLFVANDLFADGAALFDGAISASSSMQVTGASTFYNDVTVYGTITIPDTGGGLSVGTAGVNFANWVNFNGAGYVDNWEKAPVAITAASANLGSYLLGAGTGGTEAFSVRAGGNVFASGTITAMGLTGTSTDPLRVYGGAATGHVLIGSSLPATYRGLVATSSNDLLVGDELSVVSTARFDGAIKASSTLEVTGLSRFYATTTIAGTASAIVMGNGEWIENSTNGQFIFTTTGESSVGRFAIDVVESNGNTTLDNLNGSYLGFADNLNVVTSGRGIVYNNGSIITNSNIATDGIDFRDDENQAAPGNLVLELNGAFPILYSSNTATTTIYDTLLVSSTDSFYIRSIVNTSNVAGRMAFDDANDEFIIDVQSSSTGAGPLDVAVKLDDQAAGLSYFRVRSSTTAVWSVDSTGTVGAGGSDVAERYPSTELLLPGDVVAADPSSAGYIRRATGSPGESILGVVSTKPAIILGFYDSGSETLGYDVALVGRVPVRTSDENGPISIGDLLTLGSEPGTAVRRVGSGVAIGTALEAMASSTGSVMTFINVASQPDVLEVVSSPSRSAADLKVYRFAPYAGTIEVANLVVRESIEVRGSLRVAGSLQLEGALLTEFWDTSGGQLRVGDAAAIVGPNEVGVTWADRNPAVPAIGLVAEVVPIDEVDATTTVEYLMLLAQRGQLADPAQLRRLRVAVGGTLAGFTDLVPGTRYYLATQPPYPTSGTSSQEALAAEAPTAIGSIQQLLGVARNEGSLLLYVSPQYQLNQPPPPPPPSWQPAPPSNGSPPPAPEPEQKPGDQPPELTPSASPPEPSP